MDNHEQAAAAVRKAMDRIYQYISLETAIVHKKTTLTKEESLVGVFANVIHLCASTLGYASYEVAGTQLEPEDRQRIDEFCEEATTRILDHFEFTQNVFPKDRHG